jgi:hypothetical protein
MIQNRNLRLIRFFASILLFSSSLALVPVSASTAHTFVGTGAANTAATQGAVNASLFVAVERANTAVPHTSSVVATGHTVARSTSGLIFKDASSGIAQSATVTTGTVLSLYAQVSTQAAFSISGGTLAVSATATGMTMTADNYTSAMTTALFSMSPITTATPVAVLWTAPSTAGEYTVTMSVSGGTAASTVSLASPTAGTVDMVLTVTVLSSATANHSLVGGTNNVASDGRNNESLFVAVQSNIGSVAVVGGTSSSTSGVANIENSALSKGLLFKDSSNGTAQTATLLTGGVLSLYASVSTASAFSASGGSFSSAYGGAAGNSPYYNSTNTYVGIGNAITSTGIAVLWTAPATAGTYLVSLLTGFATDSSGSVVEPTASNGLVPNTLSGRITVTVVAASGGGSYSATYSRCETTASIPATTAANIDGIDSTASIANGGSWGIVFKLRDAYNANLDPGNIVVTATNSALVNIGTDATATSTPLAATSSTVVAYRAGSFDAVVVSQPTAGAPLTTTVTITYNGTTVCTKTVSIAGKVATLEVSNIQTQDLSLGTHVTDIDESGRITGQLFQVVAKDSAGNRIATDAIGTFSADSAALAAASPTVTALSIAVSATATSSTSPYSYSTGLYTCGAAAGTAKLKIKFTTTATGEAVTSPEFTLRCADNPYTYTASWDKASYVQGEIATLTVKFLDSKGNPANNVSSPGSSTMVVPMLTAVSTTGSASVLTDKDGVKAYTFTVGLATGITAGTYSTIIDFSSLTAVAATKQTPTIKISTGGDTTTNADVLKSIVALIASINKQIQALQKLILKR